MDRKSLVFLFFLVLVLIICGCGDDPAEPKSDPPAPIGNTQGSIRDLPSGYDFGDFEIVAGSDSTGLDNDGSFYVNIEDPTVVKTVFALNTDDRPVLMTMHRPIDGVELELGARETAYSLVLMHPLLMTSDPILTERVRQIVAQLPSFDTFVDVLDARISAGYLLGDPDAEVESALASVFSDYTGILAEGYKKALLEKDIGPVNGLTLMGPYIGDSELSFALQNSMKRWISVYSSTTDHSGISTDFEFVELIPSPQISLLQVMIDLLDGGGVSWPTVDSETHSVPIGGLEAVDLRCYGLGSDISLEMDDLDRALEPMICSIIFDIGIPIASVLSGADMELRGRPRNHPLMYFVTHAATNCPELSSTVYEGIRNQNMPNVVFPLIECFTEQIIDHPRIFADVINAMILDQLGAAVARRVINSWLWPIRVVNAVVTGVNVGWTLVSVSNSETVTSFRMLAGEEPEVVSTIHGTVTDAGSDEPIENAAVSVRYVGGPSIDTAISAADGSFEIEVPAGNLSVTCSMIGYQSSTLFIEISENAPMSIFLPASLLAIPGDEPGSFGGLIVDASSGYSLPGATVEVTRGLGVPDAPVLYSTVSTLDGSYQFEDIEVGSYTVSASKEGFIEQNIYVTVVSNLSLAFQDITISPLLEGEVRFVLTWGATPTDLDSHFLTPLIGGTKYHVLWNDKGSLTSLPYAQLDVDDTTSYGPETITVGEAFPGFYTYAVYLWSPGELTQSEARVVLYAEDTVMGEWSVPTIGDGRWWYICDLDVENGNLIEYNVLQEAAPPGMTSSKNGIMSKIP